MTKFSRLTLNKAIHCRLLEVLLPLLSPTSESTGENGASVLRRGTGKQASRVCWAIFPSLSSQGRKSVKALVQDESGIFLSHQCSSHFAFLADSCFWYRLLKLLTTTEPHGTSHQGCLGCPMIYPTHCPVPVKGGTPWPVNSDSYLSGGPSEHSSLWCATTVQEASLRVWGNCVRQRLERGLLQDCIPLQNIPLRQTDFILCIKQMHLEIALGLLIVPIS